MDVHTYLPSNANAVVSISGELGCDNFRHTDAKLPALLLPSGIVLPVPTYDDGQVIYIPVSGVLAITKGGTWRVKASDATLEGV